MGTLLRSLIGLLTFVGLSSCTPLGLSGGSSAGNCTTAEGTVVNTYHVTGKWKKVSPYSPSRSTTELATNFYLLIAEDGVSLGTVTAPICMGNYVNNGLSTVPFRGVFENDVKNKKITITYNEGQGAGSSAVATYSFSGSCDDTRMTLSYTGGTSEIYQIYDPAVNAGDCNPQ